MEDLVCHWSFQSAEVFFSIVKNETLFFDFFMEVFV